MENRKTPALIALAGVIVAVVVFLFITDDDTADQESETTPQAETSPPAEAEQDKAEKPQKPEEPDVPEIEIRNGEPVGGVREIEVVEGEELRVNVTTDAADELHLHGFDVYLDVVPGKTSKLVVENADIPGVLELESHSTGALIAQISVVPG